MKNKKIGLGILVMVLVFGMMVLGCDIPEEPEEPEEDQIIGVWEDIWLTSLNFKSDGTVAIWVTGWGTNTFSYELNGKTLVFTDNDGNNNSGTIKFETDDNRSKLLILSGFSASGQFYFINRTYKKN